MNEIYKDLDKLYEKIEKTENENKRLHSIIEEVKESIERGYVVECERDEQFLLNFRKNILEILDKANERNEK